jgi:hypothetical protein
MQPAFADSAITMSRVFLARGTSTGWTSTVFEKGTLTRMTQRVKAVLLLVLRFRRRHYAHRRNDRRPQDHPAGHHVGRHPGRRHVYHRGLRDPVGTPGGVFKNVDSAALDIAKQIGTLLFTAVSLAGLIVAQFTAGFSVQAAASRLLFALGANFRAA